MRTFFRDNGLSLVVLTIFLVCLVGQALTGWHVYNEEQTSHGEPTESLTGYLGTGHFAEAVFENWESEFLQMGAYVILTVFLFQRGSAESKDPDKENPSDEDPREHRDDEDAPGPVRRGGLALKLYEHSLSLAFLALFLASFVGHAWGGAAEYSDEQAQHGEPPVSAWEFVRTSRFWFESLQNWQSEFLAVGAIVILSIWLRERGSPESKPVARPHRSTGEE
jgi:hypothetical protein